MSGPAAALVAACSFSPAPVTDEGQDGEPPPHADGPARTDAPVPLGAFGPLVRLDELATGANEDDPTLTADLLEIYFESNRDGGRGEGDLWRARRARATEAFGPAENVAELNSAATESTPELAPDGLTLFFSSTRTGGLGGADVYVTTRASRDDPWRAPAHVAELSSEGSDYCATPAADLRAVTLHSNRGGSLDVFLAVRDDPAGPFGAPAPIAELNTGNAEAEPWLDASGTRLYFTSDRAGGRGDDDLWTATRGGPGEPFGPALPLDGLNDAADDGDAWLSPDERTIVISSRRDGSSDLYLATR